ncbi:MAG: PilN domain-containing protein [Microcoleus sp. PH2017_10_PVI_O_A]|uniref:PilN domain-containing protein n=1 Tax=unclassified Microcoleus TaxID=2642155 RepID=UPI001D85D2A3|nr:MULTISPECIES: PilN domain-containing protein [unclassified Microcoleus]TAE84338.1 MAG: fimbrial assembly protein [Oscillatoriales cyanobacterium]MCC3405481.1 PilN domain-containing protein [Microcoleus sp. PH2017_10_PVI_O_A]MCC3461686.1 PilN domain-containing protein [Microcoleus sp. PH2017_11_PCY_U_A]MCC3477583.1 PilN domain-containing protein [Microcoleus sp. PH2017_12_PCY_D_A]MCC3528984.1 PilN domain-containing protein [Microcoleus sp. PH2017_21_RUC_O_A]
MYSLDINFLNDRPDYKPVTAAKSSARKSSGGAKDQLPLIGAGLFALGINAAVMGAWWWATNQNSSLATEQANIEQEVAKLTTQANAIKAINAETDKVTAEYKALAGVFDQIKPWSAMLQDLSARTPAGVQIAKIEQIDPSPSPVAAAPPPPAATPAASPGASPAAGASPSPASPTPVAAPVPVAPPQAPKVQISGIASTFAQVNDFMLLVQRSPFFLNTDTKLVAATLKSNPTQLQVRNPNAAAAELPKLRPVVEYKIETTLSPTGASELLPELRSKQADGLAIRIETLQEKGVLEPEKTEVKKP